METTELTVRPTEPTDVPDPVDPTAVTDPDRADLDDLRSRLLRDAFLFAEPNIYRAGVEDALAGMRALLHTRETLH